MRPKLETGTSNLNPASHSIERSSNLLICTLNHICLDRTITRWPEILTHDVKPNNHRHRAIFYQLHNVKILFRDTKDHKNIGWTCDAFYGDTTTTIDNICSVIYMPQIEILNSNNNNSVNDINLIQICTLVHIQIHLECL